jgi:hypothetical protein
MKQTNRIMNWLVACGLALVMTASLSAQAATDRSGKVERIKGAARYSTGNNVWQPLKIGQTLKQGTLIQTAADSHVDIVFGEAGKVTPVRAVANPSSGGGGAGYQPKAEQDVVRIQADTVLALDKLSVIDTGTDKVTDTQLDLRSGRIFGTVKKMNASSRYEIKLPNGVAGVRGTVYQVSAEGVLQVLSGSLVISWTAADGTVMTQTVNGGYQFDARTGLITPLPQAIMDEMRRMAVLGTAVRSEPTTFIEDDTIYFVSPTDGDNGTTTPPGNGGGGPM